MLVSIYNMTQNFFKIEFFACKLYDFAIYTGRLLWPSIMLPKSVNH